MEESQRIYNVNLSDISVSESNVRHTDLETGIEELMESIKKYGLLQPVVLKGELEKPPYELIVGQRRFLAHKKLRMPTIRAVFRGDLNDIQAKILSLTENMHRVDLNHADKAEAITTLYKQHDRDIKKLSRELGLSTQTIRDYIEIDEQATPKAKKLLRNRKIKRADAKRVIIMAQGDPEKADRLIDLIPKLTKYDKDRAIEYAKSNPNATAEEITKDGIQPREERIVILNLPKEVAYALDKAVRTLSMDKELIALGALSEWLKSNGFLKS